MAADHTHQVPYSATNWTAAVPAASSPEKSGRDARVPGEKDHASGDAERMHQAWTKSVMLTLALWSQPYVRNNLW
jgi:hypothetical protein